MRAKEAKSCIEKLVEENQKELVEFAEQYKEFPSCEYEKLKYIAMLMLEAAETGITECLKDAELNFFSNVLFYDNFPPDYFIKMPPEEKHTMFQDFRDTFQHILCNSLKEVLKG